MSFGVMVVADHVESELLRNVGAFLLACSMALMFVWFFGVELARRCNRRGRLLVRLGFAGFMASSVAYSAAINDGYLAIAHIAEWFGIIGIVACLKGLFVPSRGD